MALRNASSANTRFSTGNIRSSRVRREKEKRRKRLKETMILPDPEKERNSNRAEKENLNPDGKANSNLVAKGNSNLVAKGNSSHAEKESTSHVGKGSSNLVKKETSSRDGKKEALPGMTGTESLEASSVGKEIRELRENSEETVSLGYQRRKKSNFIDS